MRIFVFLCLFLSSCNRPEIEPQYQKYVTLFEEESKNAGHPIIVGKISIQSRLLLGGYILAQCWRYTFPNPTILVSIVYWNKLNETEREMLLLHEIAHCKLNRTHRNATYPDGRPKSLMNSEIFDPKDYLANRKEYISELFE